jgi:hypothetical protein
VWENYKFVDAKQLIELLIEICWRLLLLLF